MNITELLRFNELIEKYAISRGATEALIDLISDISDAAFDRGKGAGFDSGYFSAIDHARLDD